MSGGGPTSVTISEETPVSMVVSWVPPNAHVLQYRLTYTALSGVETQDSTVSELRSSSGLLHHSASGLSYLPSCVVQPDLTVSREFTSLVLCICHPQLLVSGSEKRVVLKELQPDTRYGVVVTAEYRNKEGGSGSAQGKTGEFNRINGFYMTLDLRITILFRRKLMLKYECST